MAASDTQEGGASAAGGEAWNDAPEPQRVLVAVGEKTAPDDAAVAPGASDNEEEGEAGAVDALAPLRELEAVGEQTASEHAPVVPGAAEDEDVARGAVEAERDGAPEPDEEHGGKEEDGDATEGEEDGKEEDEEDAPTHLPFAPTDEELLEDMATLDPSYTISLIRKLIPERSNLKKVFNDKRSANRADGETKQPDNKDPSGRSDKQGCPEEQSISSQDLLEDCGSILRDLAASEPKAELMIQNSVLEVLLENLRVTDSSRFKEVCLGIMGNLACHESLVDAICLEKGLIAIVVEQLFLDDINCLSSTFRLLAAILRSRTSVSLAEALLPYEIISRILWILGNTANLTLLEKSIDFLSTIIDDEDVSDMLIQPLLRVGLVDHVINLLTNEMEISPGEKVARSGFVDVVLHFAEKLSAIHGVSEVMSFTSSDRLIKVLLSIKALDKLEDCDEMNPDTPTVIATSKTFTECSLEVGADANISVNDCDEMNPDTPTVIATSKTFTECSLEVGTDANISINLQVKEHHSYINCPSVPSKRVVRLALIFLIMMGSTFLASANVRPTCEVTSLATNVRLFCTANRPSSSCCESLRAAAMSHGRRTCLCLVGSSPDIITIGFSPENLVRLYAQCTEQDDGFSCEAAVTYESEHEEFMHHHGRQHDFEDDGYVKAEPEEEVRDDLERGKRMPQHDGKQHDFEDDGYEKVEPHEEDKKKHQETEGEMHGSKEGEHKEEGDQQKETGHLRKQQGDTGSIEDQRYGYEYQPRSHNGSIIGIFAVARHYRQHHRLNIRQLVHLAADAALPALASQARLAAPVGLPLQQPTPATPAAPAAVNGLPVQGLQLAFFPGPVEIVSLVLYIVLDKMRRSLRA